MKNRNALLLIAKGLARSSNVNRFVVDGEVFVGRQENSDIALTDKELSRRHCRIEVDGDSAFIEDLGSKNGTFVNGRKLTGFRRLYDESVIRIGQTVLVLKKDAEEFFDTENEQKEECLGRFYGPLLLRELQESFKNNRHLLIAGPIGVGKEFAARKLSEIVEKQLVVFKILGGTPLGELEQLSSRTTKGDIFFVGNADQLPGSLQRRLLNQVTDSTILFASDKPAPLYGLDKVLLESLAVVEIPPLSSRIEDIPSLFDYFLTKALEEISLGIQEIEADLIADYYEILMVDGFKGSNLPGLEDLAKRITALIQTGVKPEKALMEVFDKRFE